MKDNNDFIMFDEHHFKWPDMRRIDPSKIESIEDVRLLIKAFNLAIDVNNEMNKDIVHLTEDKQNEQV